MIRSFIALPLPGEVQAALGQVATALAPGCQGIKWVKPENIHLTLRFLGDTNPGKVAALGAGLDQIAAQRAPFPLRLGELGAFPNQRSTSRVASAAAQMQLQGNLGGLPNLHRPRVLWVGLEEQGGHLHQLQRAVEHLSHSLGWKRETQQFKPHLTLGRVREGGSVPQEMPTVPPLEFQADHIELIESRLKPGGPQYLTLHQAVLSGPQ